MSNRMGPNYMSRAERAARRSKILLMLEDGNRPSFIAEVFGLTTDHVRQIAVDAGRRPPINPDEVRISSMWEMDEDDRRQEIIARAAKGARETLKSTAEMHKRKPWNTGKKSAFLKVSRQAQG